MFKKRFLSCLALAVISLGMHPYSFAEPSSGSSLQQRIGELFSNKKEDVLLEPDLAFKVKVAFKGPTTLVADLMPSQGYYLYKDRIRFSVKNSSDVVITAVKLPDGKVANDPTFGRTETYEKPIQARITLQRAPKAKSFTLVAAYQGCHKGTGVCYPPIEKELKLTLP
ncbi:MAG: protein-disulfide reductase DsbD N-terminal domain-containing protein [Burkholderiaceae bacterium]